MKYYKISEDELRELLENYLELSMLNWDGVDNGEGMGHLVMS